MTRQSLRVLIVADPADAESLLKEIQRGGYEVTYDQVQSAADLRGALEAAPWDLVISSGSLPGFAALDALGVVKATGRDLPFIIISGSIGEEAVAAAFQAGAADLLFEGRLARLLPAVAKVRQEATARAERLRVIETLSRSEAHYRSLVDQAVFGICQASADGRIHAVNPALVTLLGYPSADALRAVLLPDLFAEESGRVALLQRVKAGARFLNDEALWRPKSGEPIRVRLSGAPLDAPDRGPSLFEFFIEDVTERRRRQDQRLQAQRIEDMGQLAADLAHDFTDPLTAILGYGELLAEQLPADAPGGQDVRALVIAAERAAVLARQLLAVGGTQPIAVAPLDLNELIRRVEPTLRRLAGESIQIKTVLANDIGPVMADPHQVEQVIVNLAVRARSAMVTGGVLTIESRASIRESEFRGAELGSNAAAFALLRVSDTSAAQAPKAPARAGDPASAGSDQGRATDLDLAAASAIMGRIGGGIYADRDASRGTSYQVYLRKAERTAKVARVPPVPASAPGQETVLLVDDEESVRACVRAVLTRHGYTVLEAPSAEGALELLAERRQPVHLLLTDIALGGMDGRQLAARVSVEHPFMRVLLMSGYPDRQEPGGPTRSALPFLEKPFAVTLLIKRVREALVAPVAAR